MNKFTILWFSVDFLLSFQTISTYHDCVWFSMLESTQKLLILTIFIVKFIEKLKTHELCVSKRFKALDDYSVTCMLKRFSLLMKSINFMLNEYRSDVKLNRNQLQMINIE